MSRPLKTCIPPGDWHALPLASGDNATHPERPVRITFAPVAVLGTGPRVLVANSALPSTGVETLVDLAAAKPGTIDYASARSGGSDHLGGQVRITLGSVPLTQPQIGSSRVLTSDGFARLIALEIGKRVQIAREADMLPQ